MPILGTIASSTRQGLVTNSYFSIASQEITGAGGGVVTFSSIPTDYQHLEIRIVSKSANTTYNSIYITARFNNDSSALYTSQRIYGNPSASTMAAMGDGGYTDQFICGELVANKSGIPANTSSPMVIRVMDYLDTSKFTSVSSIGGYTINAGATGTVDVGNALYRSTSAINRIDLYGDFRNYTLASLYGMKG
jgi:hypothetical protein